MGDVLVVCEVVFAAEFRHFRDGVVRVAAFYDARKKVLAFVFQISAAHAVESFRGNELFPVFVVGVEDEGVGMVGEEGLAAPFDLGIGKIKAFQDSAVGEVALTSKGKASLEFDNDLNGVFWKGLFKKSGGPFRSHAVGTGRAAAFFVKNADGIHKTPTGALFP